MDFGTTHVLTPIPTRNVTMSNLGHGTITIGASDIWLTGDAEGNFTLNTPNLPVDIVVYDPYSFSVQFIPQSPGFKTATLNIQDNLTRTIHTIPLIGEAIAEPISNVALLEGEFWVPNAARLEWLSLYGDPSQGGFAHWDDSINREAIGLGEWNANMIVMFGSEVMEHTTGQILDGVMIHLNEAPESVDYVNVWSATHASFVPLALLTSQAVSGLTTGWNYIPLDPPVPTAGLEALYVGYHANGTPGTYPVTSDGLPCIVGRGRLVEIDNKWGDLAENSTGNWLIHAHFTDEAEYRMTKPIAPLSPKAIHAQEMSVEDLRNLSFETRQIKEADRALRGFNIYRDNVLIDMQTGWNYEYLDEGLSPGTYLYAVQPVHYTGNGPISHTVSVTIPYPPPPYTLPFTEDWSLGIGANWWGLGGDNWRIDKYYGDPAPSVRFYYLPREYNYVMPLTSYKLDATGIDNVHLSFRLSMQDYSDWDENNLACEVWDGTYWHRLGEVNTSVGAFDWVTVYYDISEYAANREFKIRFLAWGEDSDMFIQWNIDNIHVYHIPDMLDAVTDLRLYQSGTNVILEWSPVEHAEWYGAYISLDPYSDFILVDILYSADSITIPMDELDIDKIFIRITAGAGEPPIPVD
ncbi:MAG: hypothetical protein GX122_08010 [Candidatus Cloacimonetes bacterium]|nr:hypothetical protein [Candidatus Cloacimonadota bacterium]